MRKYLWLGVAALAFGQAGHAAVIDNGTIQLGVDDYGQLNVPNATSTDTIGLTDLRTGHESTSPGCLCEGWSVGIAGTGEFGGANNAIGVTNLTTVSFTSDATSATSVVDMGTSLRVTHAFSPAPETDDLYRVTVTIENISGAIVDDLRYRRMMDWDVEPTAFNEYVTIGGTAAATAVLFASNNGFSGLDLFDGGTDIGFTGDFTDAGPRDHGALFDFGFGALGIDESFTFEIFYGASLTEAGAFTALNAVGAEVYSLGQSVFDQNGGTPGYSTFIFGFAGVGGIVVPPPIPLPGSAVLLLGGIGLLGGLRLRRRIT
jgi:type IV pilus assembly protein PilY1